MHYCYGIHACIVKIKQLKPNYPNQCSFQELLWTPLFPTMNLYTLTPQTLSISSRKTVPNAASLQAQSALISKLTTGKLFSKTVPSLFFLYRLFRMRLVHSGDSIFSNDVSFENTVGQIQFETDRIYTGTLEGKEEVGGFSRVRLFTHQQAV